MTHRSTRREDNLLLQDVWMDNILIKILYNNNFNIIRRPHKIAKSDN
jgi:hypothetical protein